MSSIDDYTYLRNFHYSIQSDKVKETQWLYQNDSNSGNYDTGKLVFDLSQFANNTQNYQDWSRGHIVIPMVATMNGHKLDAGGSGASTLTRADFALALKNSSVNLINHAVLNVNTKGVLNNNNYSNIPYYVTQITSASLDDENANSYVGLNNLDTPNSYCYNRTITGNSNLPLTVNGNGFVSNYCTQGPYNYSTQPSNLGNVVNEGLRSRCRDIKTLNLQQSDAGAVSFLTGNVLLEDEDTLRNTLRNYTKCRSNVTNQGDEYTASYGNAYQVWYFTVIIKLADICGGYFKNLGLIKGSHYVKLTLDMNVGSFLLKQQGTAAGVNKILFNGETTFNYTCPIMINPAAISVQGHASISNQLCVSLGVAKPPSSLVSSYLGVQHSTLGLAHPLSTARIYVPSVKLQTDAEIALVNKGIFKKIMFDEVLQVQTSVGPKTALNYFVGASIRGAYALLIAPYISSSIHGLLYNQTDPTGATQDTSIVTRSFSVLQSPFAPLVCPITLRQFQVIKDGKNMFSQGPVDYSWEHWLEQVRGFKSLNGNDEMGLSSCIAEMSKESWENGNRFYLVNLENDGVNASSNISVNFTNSASVPCDVLIWVLCKKEMVVNTQSGQFEASSD